jgi:phosphohistidine phosphatase
MKTLFLVRHAKSSWDDPALPDRERPLNSRGERDVETMSRRLLQDEVQPDLIVTSPAARAVATARALANGLGCPLARIVVQDRLYAATADDLISVVESLDDGLACVMLVGHNPEMTDLAHRLSSRIGHLPTCAVAEFRFDAEVWAGVGRARLLHARFDSPKHAPG